MTLHFNNRHHQIKIKCTFATKMFPINVSMEFITRQVNKAVFFNEKNN